MTPVYPGQLSHVEILVRNGEQLTACAEFYGSIGLKIVEQNEQQLWLQHFSTIERDQLALHIAICDDINEQTAEECNNHMAGRFNLTLSCSSFTVSHW
jgi:hypothetical protein